MPKFEVTGSVDCVVLIGKYEADSKEEAERMAEDDESADWYPTLCHQCSREVEVGDITEVYVNEVQ